MNEERYREAERRLWDSVGRHPTERRLHLRGLDTDVRVQEDGDGPVVVFVHGGSASGANWAPLIGHLDGVRAVLLDRPGCGLSPPVDADLSDRGRLTAYADELVADVIDALEVPTAHVVATSLGGFFAMRAAAAHPNRIERMVLFGYTVGARLEHFPLSMRLATLPGLRHVMTRLPPTKGAIRAIMRQLGHRAALRDGRITPELLEWFRAVFRHTPSMRNDTNLPRDLLGTGEQRDSLLPPELLARATCPIRFVWGETDPIGGADVAREFVAYLPQAELELWPATGHAPWIDDPELAAARVSDFLAR